jgi:hypothetical protein
MSAAETLAAISGAIAMGYAVVALLFLRFRRDTGDRLFQSFGCAFALLALQRLAFTLIGEGNEDHVYLYLVRLGAYLLILKAIVDKNRDDRVPSA